MRTLGKQTKQWGHKNRCLPYMSHLEQAAAAVFALKYYVHLFPEIVLYWALFACIYLGSTSRQSRAVPKITKF